VDDRDNRRRRLIAPQGVSTPPLVPGETPRQQQLLERNAFCMQVLIRTVRFIVIVASVALVATLPVDAQTTSSPTSPGALQNQLIVRADGTIYLVRDGVKHAVTPASLSDDAIGDIPEGSAYSSGLVPVDAITALVGSSPSGPAIGPSAPLISAPAPAVAASPASSAPIAAAPAPTPPPALPSSVKVALQEWSIAPDSTTLAAGRVTFDVTDTGKGEHEMGVYKTDKDPGNLPASKGKVDETSVGQKIGELEGFKAGDEKSASFDLTPGTYILICNLTNHYNKGMVSQLQVK
jgi:uncharacterized cupredoxin-like copper-binding protein